MSLSTEQICSLMKATWSALINISVPKAVKMANAVDWRWHEDGIYVPVTSRKFYSRLMNLFEMIVSHAEEMGHLSFAGTWSHGFHYIVSDYDDEVTVTIVWGVSGMSDPK